MRAKGPAGRRASVALATLLLASAAVSGCSVRRFAIGKIGDALAGGAGVYASDDDPELVGAALPFALKTMEGLLAQDPGNADLLLAAASGFAQYAWGWVQLPAQRLRETDYEAAQRQLARALRLYLRARDYGLRGLELRHPGFRDRLLRDPDAAAGELGREDLAFTYWTAAAWGAAIAAGKDRPELLADLGAVQALVGRVLELDETWGDGAAHEVAIALAAAVPAAMGGGAERARQHYERAVALAGGRRAAPHLAVAESVDLPAQDRDAWERHLQQALAVDPDADPSSRLANLLAQEQAAWLLEHGGDRFLDSGDEPWPEEEPPEEAGGDDGEEAAGAAEDPRPAPPERSGGHP